MPLLGGVGDKRGTLHRSPCHEPHTHFRGTLLRGETLERDEEERPQCNPHEPATRRDQVHQHRRFESEVGLD